MYGIEQNGTSFSVDNSNHGAKAFGFSIIYWMTAVFLWLWLLVFSMPVVAQIVIETGDLEVTYSYQGATPSVTGANCNGLLALIQTTAGETVSSLLQPNCDTHSFASLSVGDYNLNLLFDGQGGMGVPPIPFTIQANQTTTLNYDLTPALGTLKGVVLVDGVPLANNFIRGQRSAATGGGGTQEYRTGSDGSFNVFMTPGDYTIEIRDTSGVFLTSVDSVIITAGQSTDLGSVLPRTIAECQTGVDNLTLSTEQANFLGGQAQKNKNKSIGFLNDAYSSLGNSNFPAASASVMDYQKYILRLEGSSKLDLGVPPIPDLIGESNEVLLCITELDAINIIPIANAGPDQTALIGDVVALDGSASSDGDGDPLSFAWIFTPPAGSGAGLSDSSSINPTFVVDVPGEYTAQLIVNDGQEDSTADFVTITTTGATTVGECQLMIDDLIFETEGANYGGNRPQREREKAIGFLASAQLSLDELIFNSAIKSMTDYRRLTLRQISQGKLDLGDPPNPDLVGMADEVILCIERIEVINTPPTANAGPDQTVFVSDIVTLDGSASSDPNGDALTYLWMFTSVPTGSSATLSDTTAVMPTFEIDLSGTYIAELIVNDGQADSQPDSITIDTNNSPPVANAGPDQSALIGDTVTLDASSSTDIDGDDLTYLWSFTVNIPAGTTAVISDPTAIMPTFDVDLHGSYEVQLVVNDGFVNSDLDTVTVSITNVPPVANAGPDQTAQITDTVTLDGSASNDADGDSLAFFWSFASKPTGSSAVFSDPNAVMPSFIMDVSDDYIAQLIVNDGIDNSPPDTVLISITNTLPVANAGLDQTVTESDTVFLDGIESSDADGDALTFTWSFTSVPAGSAAAFDDVNLDTPSFVADVEGQYVVQLIVNDGKGDSAPDTAVITTIDTPPVADAGTNQDVKVGDTVQLDGSGSFDADGDPLTFSWSITSQPLNSIATLDDASLEMPSFLADAEGLFVTQLVVNDAKVNSAPDTVSVMAAANNTPNAVDDTATVNEDSSNNVIDVLSDDTDDDGDSLTIESVTQPTNGSVINNGNNVSYTPNADFFGADTFTYTISDGNGGSDIANVNVTVDSVNDEPTLELLADITIEEDASEQTVNLIGIGTGAANEIQVLAITAVSDDAGVIPNPTVTYSSPDATGTLSFAPLADVNGTVTITVTLTDDGGTANGGEDNIVRTFVVTVEAVNDQPEAVTDDLDVNEASEDNLLDVLLNDLDVDEDSLSISSVTDPLHGTVSNQGAHLLYTPEATYIGPDSFEYTISDGVLSSTATVNITVIDINQIPIADAGIDQSVITIDVIQLIGSGSHDPDGDDITYLWSLDSSPVGGAAVFSDATLSDPTVTVNIPGTYVFKLIVADETQESLPDFSQIIVDLAPILNVNDVQVLEGDSGTTEAIFTVSISSSIDRIVEVEYRTGSGGASEGVDFESTSGVLSFPNNSTTAQTVSVPVIGDINFESNETFTLRLENAVNAAIGTHGTGTILNDDPDPLLVITLTPSPLQIQTLSGDSMNVQLGFTAGPGGQQINFSVDNGLIAMPSSVVVPEGQTGTSVFIQSGSTTGVSLVSATSSGLNNASSEVHVSSRLGQIDLSSALVAPGRNIDASLVLGRVAPAGGVSFSLVSSDDSVASVSAGTIIVPEGETTAGFIISGITTGATSITATSVGFAIAGATVNVTSQFIVLGADLSIGPGQTSSLPISLSTPAVGDVSINLFSSDETIATVAPAIVIIPNGETLPATNPQVSGVDFGVVQIDATASGYAPDSRAVTVSLSLSLEPGSLSVPATKTDTLTLTLSSPAPTGGFSVDISSDDPAVATVSPLTVTVPQGQLQAVLTVGGVTEGDTVVRASATGATGDSSNIHIEPPPVIPKLYVCVDASNGCYTDTNAPVRRVGEDLQKQMRVYLQEAPDAPVTVTATSASGASVLVSSVETAAGTLTASQANVTSTSYNNNVRFWLQGMQQGTATTVTFSAEGYEDAVVTINVDPSGFRWGSGDFATNTSATPNNLWPSPARLTAGTLVYAEWQEVRGGLSPVSVAITSTDSTVGTLTPNPLVFQAIADNGTSASTTKTAFDPTNGGTTDLALVTPAGFETPSTQTTITATVTAPKLLVCVDASNGCYAGTSAPVRRVGEDLQKQMRVRLEEAPEAPVTVTATSASGASVLVSSVETAAGALTATQANVTSTNYNNNVRFWLQGMQQGTATTVTFSAEGYEDAVVTINVDPSGFRWGSGDFATNTSATPNNLWPSPARLTAGTLVYAEWQEVRGGLSPVSVAITSTDSTVGTLTPNPLVFQAIADNGTSASTTKTAFDPSNGGTTDLALVTPAGFETPSTQTTITATVTAPKLLVCIDASNGCYAGTSAPVRRVGEDLQKQMRVRLEEAPEAPVTVTATSASGASVLVSSVETAAGALTATQANVTSTSYNNNVRFWLQGMQQGTATTVTFSAEGYEDAVVTINVDPSGFVATTGDFSTTATSSNSTISIYAARLTPLTLAYAERQELSGSSSSVGIDVSSSDPAIGVITTSPVFVQTIEDNAVSEAARTQFEPIAAGSLAITIETPSGWDTPDLGGGTNSVVYVTVTP